MYKDIILILCLVELEGRGGKKDELCNKDLIFSIYQSAIQDVDYENELDLLYAVVTLHDPSREGSMEASLYFVHDKTGDLLKKVPLPTWKPVS